MGLPIANMFSGVLSGDTGGMADINNIPEGLLVVGHNHYFRIKFKTPPPTSYEYCPASASEVPVISY